jgi:hypothetical protein
MPVNDKQVIHIASMLTDDPDIVTEGEILSESPGGSMSGEFIGEVPLDPAAGIVGRIRYSYSYNISGSHSPQTYHEPAEYPEIEIVDVHVEEIQATDQNGRPVQITAPMIKIAHDYFWSNLMEQAIDQEYKKHDGFTRTEPDYDEHGY